MDTKTTRKLEALSRKVTERENQYRQAVEARDQMIVEARKTGMSWGKLSEITKMSLRNLHRIKNRIAA